jgi:hypothetical protein
MELEVRRMPEVNGDLDLADIDTNQPVPAGWVPEQDELPFPASDKNEDPNC